MDYSPQPSSRLPKVKPRLIIHGGAGNIRPATMPPEKCRAYREALLSIVSRTHAYMNTPIPCPPSSSSPGTRLGATTTFPAALDVATHAVTMLEDNPLFNSGHGAVFTRDGVNELEASVMVSRGHAKRGVGVMGLRRVRNPILLARAMLEHGDDDLSATKKQSPNTDSPAPLIIGGAPTVFVGYGDREPRPDAPSAQGHTQIFGKTAEELARKYGLEMVHPRYFFTQNRWDEHVRALEREKEQGTASSATWSSEEYLPQGTCGAIALDEDGVVCAATSTGGLTNKLTGRIGDTPCVGAGFWAEEWDEEGDPAGDRARRMAGGNMWERAQEYIRQPGAMVQLSETLKGLMADCLPSPTLYAPLSQDARSGSLTTTRSIGASGTGNGDSFLRTAAVRTVAAIARFKGVPSAEALSQVAGPRGELQRSAGDRWGRTGEGEGGMIGIECAVVRDGRGSIVDRRGEILQDFNCGGMFRAWIDDDDNAVVRIWRDDALLGDGEKEQSGEGRAEDSRGWADEKAMLKLKGL